MRAFAQGLLGALVLVAALLLVLFASAAQAQVKDMPILALPTNPALVVIDINATEQKACAVWWERDTNPYGDWHLAKAFCEGVACVGVTTDLPKMIANRTRNVTKADVALLRCNTVAKELSEYNRSYQCFIPGEKTAVVTYRLAEKGVPPPSPNGDQQVAGL